MTNMKQDQNKPREIEERIREITNGKVRCNCDCGGPFCNTLVHRCFKEDEHYAQREDMYINFLKESYSKIKQELIAEIKSELMNMKSIGDFSLSEVNEILDSV